MIVGTVFLSTPSARRATLSAENSDEAEIFLSTPSARRATYGEHQVWILKGISIHALREEGDRNHSCQIMAYALFLSTPSARRATTSCNVQPRYLVISIHALREEGD